MKKFETLVLSVMSTVLLAGFIFGAVYCISRTQAPTVVSKTVKVEMARYPVLPKYLTVGTYRVRCQALQKTYAIVTATRDSSGTAWGVDLSEYGIKEKKYLMTAAHVVLVEQRPVDKVEIQVRTEKVKKWLTCKIVAVDKDRDLALLEAPEEIPVVFKLGAEPEIGTPVVHSGCPVGTVPSAALGFLTSKDPEGPLALRCKIWQASVPFFSGSSGGPVFDAETGNVIAILVAGISSNGSMVPNLAFIIPVFEVRHFLDTLFKLPDEPVIQIIPLPQVKPVPIPVAPPQPAPKPPEQKVPAPEAKPQPKAETVPVPKPTAPEEPPTF